MTSLALGSSADQGAALGTLRRVGWFVSTANAVFAAYLASSAYMFERMIQSDPHKFKPSSYNPTDPFEYFVISDELSGSFGGIYAIAIVFQIFMLTQFVRRMASAGYGPVVAVSGYGAALAVCAGLNFAGWGLMSYTVGMIVLVVGCVLPEQRA
jgi:hypothetical protein